MSAATSAGQVSTFCPLRPTPTGSSSPPFQASRLLLRRVLFVGFPRAGPSPSSLDLRRPRAGLPSTCWTLAVHASSLDPRRPPSSLDPRRPSLHRWTSTATFCPLWPPRLRWTLVVHAASSLDPVLVLELDPRPRGPIYMVMKHSTSSKAFLAANVRFARSRSKIFIFIREAGQCRALYVHYFIYL